MDVFGGAPCKKAGIKSFVPLASSSRSLWFINRKGAMEHAKIAKSVKDKCLVGKHWFSPEEGIHTMKECHV